MSNSIQSLDERIRARAHKEATHEIERAVKQLGDFCGSQIYARLNVNLELGGCGTIEKDEGGKITGVTITVDHALKLLRAYAIEHTSAHRQDSAIQSFIQQVDSLMDQLNDKVSE